MELVVTDEQIDRQPPETQAIIRALLAKMAEMEAALRELRRQVKGKTPQHSSLPPSTQHPHAKPQRKKRKSKKKRGGQPGHKRHQRHRLACPCCGETTCAELPAGVPQGQSGPRLMAFTALLMAYYRQSKRRTAEFLTTLLGHGLCRCRLLAWR